MIGRIEETSASFEARSAPRSYPTLKRSAEELIRTGFLEFAKIKRLAKD
jgi:hypothetical protein